MTRKSFTSRKDPTVTERKIDYMREHLAEIAKNAEKSRLTEVKEQEEIDEEWEERVEEIYDMVFEAAREGKYEYAVGAYLEEYNERTYLHIVQELKSRLGNCIVLCSKNKKVLTISWGSNES